MLTDFDLRALLATTEKSLVVLLWLEYVEKHILLNTEFVGYFIYEIRKGVFKFRKNSNVLMLLNCSEVDEKIIELA